MKIIPANELKEIKINNEINERNIKEREERKFQEELRKFYLEDAIKISETMKTYVEHGRYTMEVNLGKYTYFNEHIHLTIYSYEKRKEVKNVLCPTWKANCIAELLIEQGYKCTIKRDICSIRGEAEFKLIVSIGEDNEKEG